MRVFLTGGTGLIGRRIVERLLARGDEMVLLSRRAAEVRKSMGTGPVEVLPGDPTQPGDWQSAVEGVDAVINLAGLNIFDKRWNSKVKQTIRDSRVHSTEQVVNAIKRAQSRPKVLVHASAIGYYGPHGDEELNEESPPGSDFMAGVCKEWEAAAAPVAESGTRLALIRTGIVLAKGEGALGVMTPIFRWGGAAPVGSGENSLAPGTGRQWMSWIHLDDIVGIYLLALDKPSAAGPINGTAPHPVRNVEFARELAHTLLRPLLPIGPPDFGLRGLLGEVAEVVVKGQKVLPTKVVALGYRFQFPILSEALNQLFSNPAPK